MTTSLTLFLSGDVMPGRGIDQILPHRSPRRLYEPYVNDAGDYVRLAERRHGPLPRKVDYNYIWGEALAMLDQAAPALRIINLETAITRSDDHWRGKGINYRMHPGNTPCLLAAAIDCCVLANNHVLDWGYHGLEETLVTLHAAGIATAGAGSSLAEAQQPAILAVPGKGRVLVFALGHPGSGIPAEWAAATQGAGVTLVERLTEEIVKQLAGRIHADRRAGDVVVVSIHWGGNWGYNISVEHQRFAHLLIDEAGVDVVHGHSSHHAKGIEVYHDHLILYGCGDLLNDYEGIEGYAQYRDDLGLLYLPQLEQASGTLQRLDLLPTKIRRFRLQRPSLEECRWLATMFNREGEALGTQVRMDSDGRLSLEW